MLSPSETFELLHVPLENMGGNEPATRPTRSAREDVDPRQLIRELKAFTQPRAARAWWELAITLVPFVVMCGLMFAAVAAGHWVALALTVPAGLLLLRIFLIQHDCGHGAFLPGRSANDWLGRALGVLTLTPYDCWKRSHALHHASTGNLDARGFGDIDTLTIREFYARTGWRRLLYRLYRHPVVLLGVGPAFLFLLRHRLPIGLMKEGKLYWVSAMATTRRHCSCCAAGRSFRDRGGCSSCTAGGADRRVDRGLAVLHPASIRRGALGRRSQLVVPRCRRWAEARISTCRRCCAGSPPTSASTTSTIWSAGSLSIASRSAHGASPACRVNRFTASQTFGMLRLALWDEDRRRLVSFAEAERSALRRAR
jgi:omega-6 fatty acid desaturase (delta-12 desaturase)